jgi:hypothetical protein
MPVFSTTIFDVTLDESPGLQNLTATPSPGGDADDNDVLLSSTTAAATTTRVTGAGYTATAVGAASNQVISYTSAPSTAASLSLSTSGNPATLASGLFTTSGFAITLELVANDLIIGTYTPTGGAKTVAFALLMEPVAASGSSLGGLRITTVEYTALNHLSTSSADDALNLAGKVYVNVGGEIAFNNFSAAPAGQNLWTAVTQSGVQILVTGRDLGVDTVNTRNTSLGSNNQSIDPGEGLYFDFVTGQTAPTSTTAKSLSGINFTDRHEGTTGGFTIAQTGGSAKTQVTAQITAYDSTELGASYGDGTIDAPTATISTVSVYSATNTLIASWNGSVATGDASIGFVQNGDAVTVSGLLVNYRVSYSVEAGDKLDRFSVVNTGTKSFDLGDIRIGSAVGEQAAIGEHVRFEDDGPLAISPQAGTVTNGAGVAASFALDDGSTFSVNYGTDGAGSVLFAATGPGTLSDTSGNVLTSGGTPITLAGWGTNVLTASAGTTQVFTVTLDASGTYAVDMDAKIDNGSISFGNFGSGGAGLRYWLGVAGTDDAAKDLLVTGGTPGVTPVNNDSDDIAAANQWIDPSEVVRLDFVGGISSTTGTSSLNNIPVGAHYDVNDVGFTVMQSKGEVKGVNVTVAAIDAARNIDGTDGTSVAQDLVAGTVDTITSVTVIDGTTGVSTTYLLADGDTAKVDFLSSGAVTVFDLDAPSSSKRDQVFVSTASGFDRLEISNTDTNKQDALAIGGFNVAGDAGDPLALAFNVVIADGDGDTAAGLIGVALTP